MSILILQPADDSKVHPAYRYINAHLVNGYTPQSDQYGQELVITVNGGTSYNLLTRRDIGTFFSNHIYEFDMQALLQDLLTFDLPAFGAPKDTICANSIALVESKAYDYYLNSDGVPTRDIASELQLDPFLVSNSCRQHMDWQPGTWHFTMSRFLYGETGSSFNFLTVKGNRSRVCMTDSEFLSMIIDDDYINGISVLFFDASGNILGFGAYALQPFTYDGTGTLVTNGFRAIGVGPLNINATTWDISSGSVAVDDNVAYYVVGVGNIAGPVFTPVGNGRTYYLDCPCCPTRAQIFFLNSYGAIEVINLPDIIEYQASAKSTQFEKNLKRPHSVPDFGNARLETTGSAGYKIGGPFEQNELGLLFEFQRAMNIWSYSDGAYVPFVIKDSDIKIDDPNSGNIYAEFELQLANDYLSQRN